MLHKGGGKMRKFLVDIVALEKNETHEIESLNLELAAQLAQVMCRHEEGKVYVTDLDAGKTIEIK
jgi:hypothetical protein